MQGNSREAAFAYIAGIMDGEGTIRINRCSGEKTMKSTGRKNPVHSAHISVGMVCEKVPRFIKETMNLGSIRHERVHREDRRDMWRYAVTSRHGVLLFLERIYPFLLTKKEQAKLLIEFCDRAIYATNLKQGLPSDELQWREEMHDKMRKLNAVGAPAT